MKALKLRPLAQTDLDEIWHYTAERWGPSQAETYVRKLQAACTGLCDGTMISQSATHVLQGCLKIAVASHVVYFREDDTEVVVIRILHQRMDVARHL